MTFLPLVFAYLGPETMLPLTSVVAGAAGVIMMFGRSSYRWAASLVQRFSSKPEPVSRNRRIGSAPVGSLKARVRS